MSKTFTAEVDVDLTDFDDDDVIDRAIEICQSNELMRESLIDSLEIEEKEPIGDGSLADELKEDAIDEIREKYTVEQLWSIVQNGHI